MTPSLRLARALGLAVSLALPLSFASAADPSPSPSPTPAPAEESYPGQPAPQPESSSNIRVDVMMIAMPEDKMMALLPDLMDQEKIEKAIPDLLDAVKNKQAILEGMPIVITKSGQRAVSETVKEMRYLADEPADATPGVTVPADQSGSAAPSPSPSPTPADEVQFETRNIGVTMEVEPVVSPDNKYIDLNLSPQHVQFLGFENPPEAGKSKGTLSQEPNKQNEKRPLFYTMKVTTSITLRNGQHMLIAVHKTAQPEGYLEIFIVHAETVSTDK